VVVEDKDRLKLLVAVAVERLLLLQLLLLLLQLRPLPKDKGADVEVLLQPVVAAVRCVEVEVAAASLRHLLPWWTKNLRKSWRSRSLSRSLNQLPLQHQQLVVDEEEVEEHHRQHKLPPVEPPADKAVERKQQLAAPVAEEQHPHHRQHQQPLPLHNAAVVVQEQPEEEAAVEELLVAQQRQPEEEVAEEEVRVAAEELQQHLRQRLRQRLQRRHRATATPWDQRRVCRRTPSHGRSRTWATLLSTWSACRNYARCSKARRLRAWICWSLQATNSRRWESRYSGSARRFWLHWLRCKVKPSLGVCSFIYCCIL